MNSNIFVVNASASINVLKNELENKLFQIRALAECIRLAATTPELSNCLIHDAMWAIGDHLEQASQLQEFINDI